MILSHQAQAKARTYIAEQARPLEQALYSFHFEKGDATAVTTALAAFCNADGGFGHGLEPDIRTPASTVIATTVALQTLRAIQAPGDHPLVQGAMDYLLDHFDPVLQAWPIIDAGVAAAPHAPWWQFDDELAARWRDFAANPRAEIVGYLHDYPRFTTPDFRQALVDALVTFLEQDADRLTMNDLECYVRLVETSALPAAPRARLISLLEPVVDRLVARDPSTWDSYVLKPLNVAPDPRAHFASRVAEAVEANLDWEIDRQGEDGAWAPNWSWFGAFPETWPLAEREWKGVLTVKTLKALKNYGRLG